MTEEVNFWGTLATEPEAEKAYCKIGQHWAPRTEFGSVGFDRPLRGCKACWPGSRYPLDYKRRIALNNPRRRIRDKAAKLKAEVACGHTTRCDTFRVQGYICICGHDSRRARLEEKQ